MSSENDNNTSNEQQDAEQAPTKSSPRDILTPSSAEERELAKFIDSGHNSSTTISLLTVLGLIVLLATMLYWDKFDVHPDHGEFVSYKEITLPAMIDNQARKDSLSIKEDQIIEAPYWPLEMYRKLRFDIYLIGGMIFLLCIILTRIETAKNRRNDLLAFRALAREIEKIRIRLREDETKDQ